MQALLRAPLDEPALPVVGRVTEWFYRLAASHTVPHRFYAPPPPVVAPYTPGAHPPAIEIVSHCWRYSTLLTYQLSSLVLDPPREVEVTMTVFYTGSDERTRRVLDFFERQRVPNVRWNWWKLEPQHLFRRAIGRNLAACRTQADWLFFTDCDVLFREGALDALGRALRDRSEILVFPRRHMVTSLLENDDTVFTLSEEAVVDLPGVAWHEDVRNRATGPFQITRAEVGHALGYCGTTRYFQRPAHRWRKAHEDRVFRWLLGTPGTALDVNGFYRIRHRAKGRKGASVSLAGA